LLIRNLSFETLDDLAIDKRYIPSNKLLLPCPFKPEKILKPS
jgi:hypothetical protein